MPTYRSITIALVSQYSILTIPEYAPPLHPNDPFSPSPPLISDDPPIVSVYIPIYPSSQFWLSYSISPPYPPHALYYFKLFHNGACVVSWGCGAEDGYRGKTMFGLFDAEPGWFGEGGVEKRAFCFARERGGEAVNEGGLGDVLEVRVFRSKGRRRTEPEMGRFAQSALGDEASGGGEQQNNNGGRINFTNAGLLPYKHPRRYYNYALLDPLDQPFATFRWYYRTWEELESIGVISPAPSTATTSLHTIETDNDPPASKDDDDDEEDSYAENDALTFYNTIDAALSLHPTAADTPAAPTADPNFSPRPSKHTALADRTPTPIPTSQEPSGTHHTRKQSSTANPNAIEHPHPSRFADWLRRTPSPAKSEEDTGISPGRPRGNSMGMLKGVVAAAVRRMGVEGVRNSER